MQEALHTTDSSEYYLKVALTNMIEDLNDPLKASNDMTCFTVILLMIVAVSAPQAQLPDSR